MPLTALDGEASAVTRTGEALTVLSSPGSERLVKSTERVRDLGEVFTPAGVVSDMLDLLPSTVWGIHPSATFLEPACGDGNFLVAILARKLEAVSGELVDGGLAAGSGEAAGAFHALEALASVYAVDISPDNVIGGTPGHEVGARDRLLGVLGAWWVQVFGVRLSARMPVVRSARWIVDRNVLVGNMLESNLDGTPTGRNRLPLVEYVWDTDTREVTVETTTLGAVMKPQAADWAGVVSLFDFMDERPPVKWSGPAVDLYRAPVDAQFMATGDGG